jgi:uncharacterized protein (UPF0335 family)
VPEQKPRTLRTEKASLSAGIRTIRKRRISSTDDCETLKKCITIRKCRIDLKKKNETLKNASTQEMIDTT